MELIELLESGLIIIVTFLKLLLETIAIFCILLGVIKTGYLVYNFKRYHRQNPFT